MATNGTSSTGLPEGVDPLAIWDLIPRVHIDDSFGAILLGTFLGLTLFGLNVHQSYRYFRLYPGDRPLFRWVVITTLVLEIWNTVMGIHICYYYLVSNYFNPTALQSGVWSIKILTLNMGATMFVAQSFFARRVWLIGPAYRWVSALAGLFLLGEMAFATTATVETFILATFADFRKFTWMITVAYALASAADAILAISLLTVVRRSRQNHKREEPLLDILVVYVINTGALTSLLSITSLIFAILYSDNLIYVGFNTVATRLYANTLLSVLNSRRSAVDHGAEGFETGSLGLTLHQKRKKQAVAEEWNVPQVEPPQPTIIDIKVTTEMVKMQDGKQPGGRGGTSDDDDSTAVGDVKSKRYSEYDVAFAQRT